MELDFLVKTVFLLACVLTQIGVATGMSPTEGAKEIVSAVAAEIVTFSSDVVMSRTVSADAALRAGGWVSGRTGDMMLDEEPAAAGADGLRIGIKLRASSSSSSRGIGGVTLG